MKDHRYVDELTLEELEYVLRLRRRQERLKRMGDHPSAVDPLEATPHHKAGQPAPSVTETFPSGLTADGEGSRQRYSAVVTGRKMDRRTRRPIKWRWVRDQMLLLVEFLAVLGLIWVVIHMMTAVGEINKESRALHVLPTLTPT